MPSPRFVFRCPCSWIRTGAGGCPRRAGRSAKLIAAPPSATCGLASGFCARKENQEKKKRKSVSDTDLSGLQRSVHFFQVLLDQAAGAGLELEQVGDGVVARHRKVAHGREELLLRVEDVDVDAHADLVAELVGVERALRRDAGLL